MPKTRPADSMLHIIKTNKLGRYASWLVFMRKRSRGHRRLLVTTPKSPEAKRRSRPSKVLKLPLKQAHNPSSTPGHTESPEHLQTGMPKRGQMHRHSKFDTWRTPVKQPRELKASIRNPRKPYATACHFGSNQKESQDKNRN